MLKQILIFSLLFLVFAMGAESAEEKPSFKDYVDNLKVEAKQKGISDETLSTAFMTVKYYKKAVTADKNQPEVRLTLDQYLPRAVPKWKIREAIELYEENKPLLKEIEKKFGVQGRFIIALWGIETNFGKYTGNYDVISALATLAYDGRREALFKKQLFAALEILQQEHIAIDDFKGSWAGAMGQSQFMPTSFLSYAYDYDGDGQKDIWNNKKDVFASIANYLSSVGWDNSLTWGRQVSLAKGFDTSLAGLNKEKIKTMKEWSALGVAQYDGSILPQRDIEASLIIPDDKDGRIYLAYSNYHTLMNWNRSNYFGCAVGYLSDRIRFAE